MAFSSLREQNRQPAWWGLSSVDGVTPVQILMNPTAGGMKMDIGVSVSAVIANLPTNTPRDDNRATAVAGVSKINNSVFIPVSVNPATGAVLAQTT